MCSTGAERDQVQGGGGDHNHAFPDQLHLNRKAQQNDSVEHHDQDEDAVQRAEYIPAAARDRDPALSAATIESSS